MIYHGYCDQCQSINIREGRFKGMFPNMNDNIFELEGRRGQRQRISWSLKVAPLSHLEPSVFSPSSPSAQSGERGASKQITIFSIKGLEISSTSSFQFRMSINLIGGKVKPDHSSFVGPTLAGCQNFVKCKSDLFSGARISTFNSKLRSGSKLNSKDASGFGNQGQWTFVNWFQ